MPTPSAVRLGWAEHLFIGYSVLVPALAIAGLPVLYERAAWLGHPDLAPMGPFLALCSCVACIIYLGAASHRLSFPRNRLWCVVLALDTPLLVSLYALIQGRVDVGIFGWDGIIELCSVMLAATAMWACAQPRIDGIVMGFLLGAFGALAPCLLLLFLLESIWQAVVVAIALAGGSVTWFHLLHGREVAEQSDRDQTRWMLVGIGAIFAALGYSVYRVIA